MTKSLIEQIEEAVTKDDLELLAAQLNVEINKRQGVETIRAEMLETAEKLAEQGVTHPEGEGGQGGDGGGSSAPDDEPAPKKAAYKGRMLQHTKTGANSHGRRRWPKAAT